MPRWNPPADLVGRKFGKLEVLHEGPRRGGMRAYWCRCRCGEEVLRREYDLRQPGDHACIGCKGRIRTLNETQRQMVRDHYDWMRHVIYQYWIRKYPDLENEIVSAAHEGMVFAAFHYKHERSANFYAPCLSYVNKKIKADIRKLFQWRTNERRLLDEVCALAARLPGVTDPPLREPP